MVFLTSILIVAIYYFLQNNGLVYITIIAVVGELINLFMTQTMTKAVEKKTVVKFSSVVKGYKIKIEAQKKKIEELEKIQEDSVRKVYAANKKVKEYEEKLGIRQDQDALPAENLTSAEKAGAKDDPKKVPADDAQKAFTDLPSGSNRKELPL